MTNIKEEQNGNEEVEMEEKKPGIVRKITKITFTIGPIKQEDLSTPELNKLMAMAQKFDITFDTVPILDSDQTDKLGYITLPFEIRSQEYLLVLYDRLSNLKLNPQRDVSVKFPEEFKKHVEEVRTYTAELRKQKLDEIKKKADKQKRSIYATYVDKDSGKASLIEKFPEAKSVNVTQHNFQWFGILEFETQEKALEVLKKQPEIEIEEQKVKLVRLAPNHAEQEKKKAQEQANIQRSNRQHSAPNKQSGGNRSGGGGGGRGGGRGGGGNFNQGPKSLLNIGGGGGGRGGYGGGGQYPVAAYGVGNMGGGGGRYQDYGGGYGGGYGNQGYGGAGAGNFQLGAKRKSDYVDFGGSPKKTFGSPRGGYGGGRGGGGWF